MVRGKPSFLLPVIRSGFSFGLVGFALIQDTTSNWHDGDRLGAAGPKEKNGALLRINFVTLTSGEGNAEHHSELHEEYEDVGSHSCLGGDGRDGRHIRLSRR